MQKATYHEHLSWLREEFQGETVVPITRVAKVLHRDYRNLLRDRTFPVQKMGGRYFVTIINLARWLAV